jgi:glucosamine 6-phosphate synthetase-like amidotransferase/phosphosugar isomerase protein
MTRVLFQGVEGEIDRGQAWVQLSASETLSNIPLLTDDPKLREECGVVAIHGHPDAARQVYLGLYALQHRGQESAGIASADGQRLANIKGMGLVSEIFTDDVLAKLPGSMAIGTPATPPPATRRYSTPSPSASTPPRASSPSPTTATSSTSATSALALNATAPISRPHPIPKSSSSSSLTPSAGTRWWTHRRLPCAASKARSPS